MVVSFCIHIPNMCICICICIYTCICIYIYVCMYICIYVESNGNQGRTKGAASKIFPPGQACLSAAQCGGGEIRIGGTPK